MTARRSKTAARPLTLKDAFETEFARREMERRQREEAERRQQEADLAGAEALHVALTADAEFVESLGLTADRRRYTVALDHERFRVSAYFEAGSVNITLSDKRAAAAGASVPRHQQTVEGVQDALRVIALFLVDEIR